MKKIKYLMGCILTFICAFTLFNITRVEAKSPISSTIAPGINPGDMDLGSIILYDDYTIVFNYRSRLKNVDIQVCQFNACNSVEEVENKIYVSGDALEFNLNNYIKKSYTQTKEYVIKASGTFYSVDNVNRTSIANLETTLTVSGTDEYENSSNEPLESSQKAIAFMNQFVIPLLYMILAATLIIKAILLALDLVKHADNREVRAEKIRAFTYLGVGLLMVGIVNTCVGFITGLFG